MNKLITPFSVTWICDTETENIQQNIENKFRKHMSLPATNHFTTPG